MFIKRADQLEPEIVHDTGAVYWIVPEGSMRDETEGSSFFDFVSEFTVQPGAQLQPHYHDTFEFYYILSGRAIMQIEDEANHVKPGDLVKIPRNARHTIWPTGDEEIRALCFSTSFQAPGERFVPCELPRVEPETSSEPARP